ncbi:MAG TPA: uroporphyrinogen decarboxylase family protein [Planctomycetota bacterium]|nr:uroporphyrinogen decarboxylase family protein [Planctomycetota bacterium]
MTGKERIRAVLSGPACGTGERPDRVPVMHISVSSRIASALLGREAYVGGGMQQWREARALWEGPDAHAEFLERSIRDAIDVSLALGHDMIRPYYWRMPRRPSACIDEHTFRYDSPDGTWEVHRLDVPTELYNRIDGSPVEERSFEDLDAEVEAAERSAEAYTPTDARFPEVLAVFERMGDRYAVRTGGPWTNIPEGDPRWLQATLLRPDLVARLLDTQVVTSLKNVAFLAAKGLTCFFGGGDFASNQGPMYSPKVFHDLMVPRLKRISDFCHELGTFHLFGTDGNLWPLADDFYVHSGIDGHYEVDRRAGMDIRSINGKYPHIALFGNISSYTLHVGTVDEVIAETRACMEEAAACGKAVVGCSNIIVPETPMRNIEAMLETIDRFR